MRALLVVLAVVLLSPATASAAEWVEGLRLSTDARGPAQLAGLPNGDLVAVWPEPTRVAVAVLFAGTAGFGSAQTAASTNGDVEPRVAVAPDGRITIAWIEATHQGGNPSMDGVVKAVSGRLGGFSPVETLDTPQRHRGIGLAVGPDGAAYVAYGRRAPDASRIDLNVAARAAGATSFGAERLVLGAVDSGASRGRIPIVATGGDATVAHHKNSVVHVVDVSAPEPPLFAGPFLHPEPSAALLRDGTYVVAHGEIDAQATAVRLRAPGATTLGPPIALPAIAGARLAAAGPDLAVLGVRVGSTEALAGIGPPAALTTRPVGVSATSGDLAAAPDGRALAATSGPNGVVAALRDVGAPFGEAATLLPGADGVAPEVATGLAQDVAAVAVRIGGDLRTFLRGRRIQTSPPSDSGPSGTATRQPKPACRPVGRRTRTLARGGAAVRFRDLGRVVITGERPALALAVRRGRKLIRRVELVQGTSRVRDTRAPYRLRVPARTSRSTGPKRIVVRMVLRDGRARSVTLRVAVARCGIAG